MNSNVVLLSACTLNISKYETFPSMWKSYRKHSDWKPIHMHFLKVECNSRFWYLAQCRRERISLKIPIKVSILALVTQYFFFYLNVMLLWISCLNHDNYLWVSAQFFFLYNLPIWNDIKIHELYHNFLGK